MRPDTVATTTTMMDIPTEFTDMETPLDDGVDHAIRATEKLTDDGEETKRVTEIRFLTDGGIHIAQQVGEHGVYNTLTLSGAIADELKTQLEETEETNV